MTYDRQEPKGERADGAAVGAGLPRDSRSPMALPLGAWSDVGLPNERQQRSYPQRQAAMPPACSDEVMASRTDSTSSAPQFELRCGGMHLTIQRIPVWLLTLVTTAAGTGAAWWTSR